MSARLFAALDAEWHSFARNPKRVPKLCWPDDDVLADFASLPDVITTLRASRRDPEIADRILVALARRAPVDDLAARTLLQALLPGLFNVAKRLGGTYVDDELEADVLAEAVARIRTYPIDRRPARIAANVTWDVFGRIARRRRQAARTRIDLVAEPEGGGGEPPEDPSTEVCDLVCDAVERGALRCRDAQLLLDIAIGHDTISRRAQREGIAYDAMNERWRRARNRLRLAVAA